MSKGIVYYKDLAAGVISETDEGYEFSYLLEYLAGDAPSAVSLTLPLTEKKYESRVLFPFFDALIPVFDGLIPEGWLLDLASKHWNVKIRDRFELLLLTCRDTIGAVTIIPEKE